MLSAHRVADVRAAEEALARTLPDGELMRRAARGIAEALDVAAGDLLLVLVGPGDNGGDALLAATHLLDRGVRVDLCLLDDDRVHRAGLDAALAAGAQVVPAPDRHRLVLDAVLGIGARPGLAGRAAAWIDWLETHAPHVWAVDVPSGVDVDAGTLPGRHVTADATITLGTAKVASLVGPAAAAGGTGPLVVDIGLGPHLPAPAVEALESHDGAVLAPFVPGPGDHKYTRGVVGVAAGSPAYAGAAHLCVAGAQSGTAGMVRFLGADALAERVVDRAPEVVPGRGRVQAWVVGPGGGDDVAEHLAVALEDGVPLVLDAGALPHLPDRLEVPALLTPHAGELAALLDVERSAVEADPLAHARAAAERWDATVLLKGARSLVVDPGGAVRVTLGAPAWLGTAGAGDVLAGLAGSLLTSGADPLDAGSVAAFLHGAAAVRANPGGPVTASAVAAALPATLAAFLAGTLPPVSSW